MVIDYVIVTIKNQSLFPSIDWCHWSNIGYWLCDSYYKESESIPSICLMSLINIGYWFCDSYYRESESIPFNLFDVTWWILVIDYVIVTIKNQSLFSSIWLMSLDKYWLLIMW